MKHKVEQALWLYIGRGVTLIEIIARFLNCIVILIISAADGIRFRILNFLTTTLFLKFDLIRL